MRGKPNFTKRKDFSDTWTMNQASHNPRTNVYLFHSLENRKNSEDYYDDKSLIAQPIFVFKKKDRPCKRSAEDYECKTENVFIGCSKKRARASTFPFQTSTSSSCRVKNNIFMSSTLLHTGPDVNATEKGLSSPAVQQVVLRPAILQPPQAPLCRKIMSIGIENILEDEHKANTEESEEINSLRNRSEHFSDAEPMNNQLAENQTPSNEKHLNFVFGENIVERVLL